MYDWKKGDTIEIDDKTGTLGELLGEGASAKVFDVEGAKSRLTV